MFAKQIDTTNRKAMIDFLKNHFRYHTMNSWNKSTSYANNVKIYNLDTTEEIKNKMYQLLEADDDDCLSMDIQQFILDFQKETGYSAGFNGRSGGYIVLYDATYDNGQFKVYPGRPIDQDEDFYDEDEWSDEDLKNRVELVSAFDQLCDEIINHVIEFCETHEMIEETINIEKKAKIFIEK